MNGALGNLGATMEKPLRRRGVGHSHLGITLALYRPHSCVWLTCARLQTKKTNIEIISSTWNIIYGLSTM